MENILRMGSFTLCPLNDCTMLTNDCIDCEYFSDQEGNYFCIFDEEKDQEFYKIKDIIVLMLELMEKGYTRIDRKELSAILNL